MATLTLKCSSADSSPFKNNGRLKITYTASNGTFKITELSGCRTDGYRTHSDSKTSVTVKVGSVSKTVKIANGIDFGANGNYKTWGATDTSWTGITGTSVSITVTMPSSTTAMGGAVFKGTVTMSYSTYTVSYDANGGTGAPASQTKTYGTALTISSTIPEKDGYNFVNWKTNQNGNIYYLEPKGTTTYNGNQTLVAQWELKTYKVSYDANGGTGAPASQTKTHGTALTLSSTKPEKDGYNFVNWKTNQNGTTYYLNAGGTTTYNGNQTLVAQWELKTYTIKYNANGGTGAPANQTKTHGTTLTLSSIKPTRTQVEGDGVTTEYTFKGWATSPTATTVAYKDGASFTTNADTTLYAVWSSTLIPNIYDVSYNTNGGSEVISQVKTKGETLVLRDVIPVKYGYSFEGWGLSADATTISYEVGADYTIDEDIVLYAIWTPWTHTVTFDINGGVGNVPEDFTVTTGMSNVIIPECSISKKEHMFKCWSTQPSGSGGMNYYAGDGYSGVKNGGTVTLYAVWNAKNIYLYFNGECVASEFIEDDCYRFNNDGTIRYVQFIESDTPIKLNNTAFYSAEFLERTVIELTNESDMYLTDESDSYLTAII